MNGFIEIVRVDYDNYQKLIKEIEDFEVQMNINGGLASGL